MRRASSTVEETEGQRGRPAGRRWVRTAVALVGTAALVAVGQPALAGQTPQYSVTCKTKIRSASTGIVYDRRADATMQTSAVVPSTVVAGTRYTISGIQNTTTWSADAAKTLALQDIQLRSSGLP